MENLIKFEFVNKSSNEKLARIVASAFVSQLDPTYDELSEIKTAVSEAVTNAIIHGYENSVGMVILEGRICDRCVEFTIIDKGCGIKDIKKAMEPLYTGKPELERSGLGFTIMESFMDKIEVKSTPNIGTTVKMKKVIKND